MLDRFNELFGGQQAMDRVRNQRMPTVGPTLDYIGVLFRHVRGLWETNMLLQKRRSRLKTGL